MSALPGLTQIHSRFHSPRATVRPELVLQNGHTLAVESVAFSRDGRLLASGGADHVAKIWDVATGRELRTLKGHSDLVVSVAFHPNDQLLATAGFDGSVKVWDIASGVLQKCGPRQYR
jgi:WD40 repeat protein